MELDFCYFWYIKMVYGVGYCLELFSDGFSVNSIEIVNWLKLNSNWVREF